MGEFHGFRPSHKHPLFRPAISCKPINFRPFYRNGINPFITCRCPSPPVEHIFFKSFTNNSFYPKCVRLNIWHQNLRRSYIWYQTLAYFVLVTKLPFPNPSCWVSIYVKGDASNAISPKVIRPYQRIINHDWPTRAGSSLQWLPATARGDPDQHPIEIVDNWNILESFLVKVPHFETPPRTFIQYMIHLHVTMWSLVVDRVIVLFGP